MEKEACCNFITKNVDKSDTRKLVSEIRTKQIIGENGANCNILCSRINQQVAEAFAEEQAEMESYSDALIEVKELPGKTRAVECSWNVGRTVNEIIPLKQITDVPNVIEDKDLISDETAIMKNLNAEAAENKFIQDDTFMDKQKLFDFSSKQETGSTIFFRYGEMPSDNIGREEITGGTCRRNDIKLADQEEKSRQVSNVCTDDEKAVRTVINKKELVSNTINTEAVATDGISPETVATDGINAKTVTTSATDSISAEAMTTDAISGEALSTNGSSVEVVATDAISAAAVKIHATRQEVVATDEINIERATTDAINSGVLEKDIISEESCAISGDARATVAVVSDSTNGGTVTADTIQQMATNTISTDVVVPYACITESILTDIAEDETVTTNNGGIIINTNFIENEEKQSIGDDELKVEKVVANDEVIMQNEVFSIDGGEVELFMELESKNDCSEVSFVKYKIKNKRKTLSNEISLNFDEQVIDLESSDNVKWKSADVLQEGWTREKPIDVENHQLKKRRNLIDECDDECSITGMVMPKKNGSHLELRHADISGRALDVRDDEDPAVVIDKLFRKLSCPVCMRNLRRPTQPVLPATNPDDAATSLNSESVCSSSVLAAFSSSVLAASTFSESSFSAANSYTVSPSSSFLMSINASTDASPTFSNQLFNDEKGQFNDSATDLLAVTRCGHVFCRACITEALKVKKQCPLCRKFLKSNQWYPLFF